MNEYQKRMAEMLAAMKSAVDNMPPRNVTYDEIVEAAWRGLRDYMDRNEIVFYQP